MKELLNEFCDRMTCRTQLRKPIVRYGQNKTGELVGNVYACDGRIAIRMPCKGLMKCCEFTTSDPEYGKIVKMLDEYLDNGGKGRFSRKGAAHITMSGEAFDAAIDHIADKAMEAMKRKRLDSAQDDYRMNLASKQIEGEIDYDVDLYSIVKLGDTYFSANCLNKIFHAWTYTDTPSEPKAKRTVEIYIKHSQPTLWVSWEGCDIILLGYRNPSDGMVPYEANGLYVVVESSSLSAGASASESASASLSASASSSSSSSASESASASSSASLRKKKGKK